MPNPNLYLSQLNIDGLLYHLKDAEARASIENLETYVGEIQSYLGYVSHIIEENELVTSTALNDLKTNKADKTDLPTKLSDLTNDIPLATKEELDTLSSTVSYLGDTISYLGGVDGEFLAELQRIFAELEGDDSNSAAAAWATLVDKLKGLSISGVDKTVKEYVDESVAYVTGNLAASFEVGQIQTHTFEVQEESLNITTVSHDVYQPAYIGEITPEPEEP